MKEAGKPYVVVFIPAFNEEDSIVGVIEQIEKIYVKDAVHKGYCTDILVIDDGSTDQTVAVSKGAGVNRVVSHLQNRGLGAAIRTGMQRAYEMGADVVVKIDADSQYDPEDIDRVVRPVIEDRADSVFGTRFKGGLQYTMPFTRAVGNRFFSWVVSKLTGLEITDGQTGLMAFSRRYLQVFDMISDYNGTQQLILDSFSKHMRIMEVPVVFRKRVAGRSFITWRYPFKVIPTILRHYMRINPFAFFVVPGVSFILMALLGSSLLQGCVTRTVWDIVVYGLLFAGIQAVFTGFWADFICRRRP